MHIVDPIRADEWAAALNDTVSYRWERYAREKNSFYLTKTNCMDRSRPLGTIFGNGRMWWCKFSVNGCRVVVKTPFFVGNSTCAECAREYLEDLIAASRSVPSSWTVVGFVRCTACNVFRDGFIECVKCRTLGGWFVDHKVRRGRDH